MGNKELQNDTKKIESEVKDICDLGESIALEARNEGKQIERKEKNIEHVRSVMNELDCSYQRAMDILRLSEDERKDIEKYFQSQKESKISFFLILKNC